MHEITAAKSIINQISDKENVEYLELEVGELAEVTPRELKQAIEDLTGWKVIVEEMPSKIKCECGFVGRAHVKQRQHDIVIYNCPMCSSVPRPIIGQFIKLKKVGYREKI